MDTQSSALHCHHRHQHSHVSTLAVPIHLKTLHLKTQTCSQTCDARAVSCAPRAPVPAEPTRPRLRQPWDGIGRGGGALEAGRAGRGLRPGSIAPLGFRSGTLPPETPGTCSNAPDIRTAHPTSESTTDTTTRQTLRKRTSPSAGLARG
eukprot:3439925-Rhodomonas_salina.7